MRNLELIRELIIKDADEIFLKSKELIEKEGSTLYKDQLYSLAIKLGIEFDGPLALERKFTESELREENIFHFDRQRKNLKRSINERIEFQNDYVLSFIQWHDERIAEINTYLESVTTFLEGYTINISELVEIIKEGFRVKEQRETDSTVVKVCQENKTQYFRIIFNKGIDFDFEANFKSLSEIPFLTLVEKSTVPLDDDNKIHVSRKNDDGEILFNINISLSPEMQMYVKTSISKQMQEYLSNYYSFETQDPDFEENVLKLKQKNNQAA